MATCDRQSPAPCSRSPNSRLPDPTSTSASIDVLLHPTAATPAQAIRSRGSYSCGRCGLPKKGHICPDGGGPVSAPRIRIRRRRALSFDVDPVSREMVEKAGVVEILNGFEKAAEGATVLPVSCMVEVLRRLSPKELMRAAAVCRRWRGCVRRVWRSAEELRLRVLSRSQMGFVGSLLHRCAGLSRLTLRMESDVDATMLACVAYSLPNLEAFEMNMAENAMNRISGYPLTTEKVSNLIISARYAKLLIPFANHISIHLMYLLGLSVTLYELCRFVAMKGFLSSLKFEGCSNVGSLNITSSSLTTLWLSDLYCVSKVALKCPNLTELSLDFCQQENDTTDLVTMMECLGCTCPLLRNVHIASIRLCDKSVFALTSANLRSLRMLSLVLGSRITDDAVTSIASCYTNLELLDLSGSSISDNGLRMIRNVLPNTLSRLLLSLCPNITCNELQFAVTQLPLLQLIDCGMSIRDTSCQYANSGETMCFPINGNGHKIRHLELSPTKSQKNYQKLIIQHDSLKKLSLWGCSGVDALYLNCPELNDLNLNLCTNLHPGILLSLGFSGSEIASRLLTHSATLPEKLLLQCPNLKDVHASGCQDMLIGAIRNQVANEFAALKTLLPCKRLADGTKRVLALHSAHQLRASLPKPALVGGVSRVEEDEENIDPALRRACTADHALFSGTTVLNTSGSRVAEDPLASDVLFLHVTAAVAAILISFRLFAIVILSFLCALIIVLTTQLLGDILCVVPRPGVLQPPASQVPAASCFPSAGTPAGIQLQLISSASANLTTLFISAYPL
ncbi:hypothetical protein ZIOFF_047735 [Zingiber officinale]|uniref:F-box domain-containing protein n=1 Tax=Zingiber officinale TaxID=94328 RepID=A0A8J5KTW6_ZINOF|nr:hypothetical protein ZIOFF_047735 [Zingiber officinale]